ncbi:hypothetical protein CEXT_508561 [Caerostris extrusa]|uniref:Uncharacterized protein n=1 Tax=Caerostris extrusa TaxID=172846 RepID=A0AAV4U7W6_CAEEX|nr:hypothetical protein CEXT_508561 [Caerostris extrusa]
MEVFITARFSNFLVHFHQKEWLYMFFAQTRRETHTNQAIALKSLKYELVKDSIIECPGEIRSSAISKPCWKLISLSSPPSAA